MKLSTKIKYGLRALLDLRDIHQGEVLSVAQLAAQQNISQLYLENIFSRLKKTGIVRSVRGYTGGYSLAKSSNTITLYDIMMALNARLSIVDKQDQNDPIRNVLSNLLWNKIDENMERYLKTLTLDQLQPDSFDDLMYYI